MRGDQARARSRQPDEPWEGPAIAETESAVPEILERVMTSRSGRDPDRRRELNVVWRLRADARPTSCRRRSPPIAASSCGSTAPVGAAGRRGRRARWQAAPDDQGSQRRLERSRSDRSLRTSTPTPSTSTASSRSIRATRTPRTATAASAPVSVVQVPGDGAAVLRRQAGAARRGAHRAVRVEERSASAARCGSTRRPTTTRARTIRCCICCTAPATSSPAGR